MEESQNHELAVRMADLARAVASPRSLQDVLAGVTAAAKELIPGVDTAGVLLIGPGNTFESLAGLNELPHELDELQMRFDEGPCRQAALADVVVRTDDFRVEQRWPRYSPGSVELGVLSGLSFKLYTADRTAGALNLFSYSAHAWDEDAVTTGMVLAAHAASAIVASRQEEQLKTALLSRDRIGQAKGIIMERFKVDDVQAFEIMRQLSQHNNTRLVDIATQIIESR
ncbi:GAF and ANTAR domain-containing protein [Mycolicibacterium goodii]|uniref:GAF and ANTAR domain-containing protein n=1 Tax=Mycolicibacterium goodii TaxID=134601 RepID=A0ABS6HSD7_MYCGD|nr:GAF and ANTAR domain-containing protein [Mycolicibacterium goodii]OKH75260.1 histidine kinase [Mycobacterium sp. SWH-M5]MBU8814456.1 GAF and ANTAR domain-containing protein [Mycolicibacterium goodii]MBU8824845.1 GAF and ANTAR domain-containing protein [Mycolicibacterium goodii]MBU8829002.1 GAF and ANTAR domain-containing protein [Mycolicibacterium goodii]MBU8839844.1 GAF and ANTAR domain-containing protein [Mycolicibacterium goodii]